MQLIIAGIGGQGILFTSRVLGQMAIDRGRTVIGSEVHGMAQRGGSVISHFKVGDYKSSLVRRGQADILMAFDQTEGLRNLFYLKKGGVFLVNAGDEAVFQNPSLQKFLADRSIRTCRFAGHEILNQHMGGNYLFLNVLILGTAAGLGLEGFEKESVVQALRELAPPKHLESNLKVFDLGMTAARN